VTVDGEPRPEPVEALAARVRAATPARLFLGRTGGSYRTSTWLALQSDHAAARDAVGEPLDLDASAMVGLQATTGLFEVSSAAKTHAEYLRRPDLGRVLSAESRSCVAERVRPGADLQIVVGDGLSATAVHAQVPALLPLLLAGAVGRGWRTGQPFAIRHCRVGILNDIGQLLSPAVVVILIGERPGLATAESLSAYMAWRPAPGHTDADRNLISNIHRRGVAIPDAVHRILDLVAALMAAKASGVAVREPDPASSGAASRRLG
jgi:ethanolamine ammonia-lyase small subunit